VVDHAFDRVSMTLAAGGRMPVMLGNADIRPWLNALPAQNLLRPVDEDRLRSRRGGG
jgi:putative SOS response-associated peptidase YedK